MTSEELKGAAERLLSSNGHGVEESRDFCADFKCVASYVLSRLATEPQQSERIATLERERDEARAAYCALRDLVQSGKCMSWGETESALRHFDYQQEWRKGDV